MKINKDSQRSPARPTHAVAEMIHPNKESLFKRPAKLFMKLIHIKRALPAIIAAGALFSLFEERKATGYSDINNSSSTNCPWTKSIYPNPRHWKP